ncbi:hypothetical protein [Clostridium folliculivorans]|uniref:Uncharacterized protein n=1 Tax=Clostridium folliculivorans TaxID=2886038 RepID=A0A9W5Y6V9_9CLOT|nr:hypothetical protein [Clostridium folliculivorans]GKU27682.1 hypothetical protein CFOLD11_45090 [Clostridium folliculivorans]GKU32442.1 hypothetical protein CFB3_45500 [Clostridium folliculivorans]
MISVNVSNEEALTLFPCKEIERSKEMFQILEDFKIILIEDGKSAKTIKATLVTLKLLMSF